jgi:hypothetical protein
VISSCREQHEKSECEGIVVRACHELRDTGHTDRDAFVSAVRVLELRHPGRDKYYYFRRIAHWLGAQRPSPGHK